MSKYLPDQQKTNLATIRRAFGDLESDLAGYAEAIERLETAGQPDISGIIERLDELSARCAHLDESVPSDKKISEIASGKAGERIGPVKGHVTQLWESLAEKDGRIDDNVHAIQDLRTDVQAVARRSCPDNAPQLAALRADLQETRQWLADLGRAWQAHRAELADHVAAEIQGLRDAVAGVAARQCPQVDLSGIHARLTSLESRECPAVPSLEPVVAEMAELRGLVQEITGGE